MTCPHCSYPHPVKGTNATDCPIYLAKLLGHWVTTQTELLCESPQISVAPLTPMRVAFCDGSNIEMIVGGNRWIRGLHSLETLTIVTTGPASIPHGPHDDSVYPRYIRQSEIPEGVQLTGLAPVGVRWAPGGIWRRGVACPAGRWPKRIARSEFAPSAALVVDEWVPIRG